MTLPLNAIVSQNKLARPGQQIPAAVDIPVFLAEFWLEIKEIDFSNLTLKYKQMNLLCSRSK